eukprot:7674086-Pyramimonas_sp.AAC.1
MRARSATTKRHLGRGLQALILLLCHLRAGKHHLSAGVRKYIHVAGHRVQTAAPSDSLSRQLIRSLAARFTLQLRDSLYGCVIQSPVARLTLQLRDSLSSCVIHSPVA